MSQVKSSLAVCMQMPFNSFIMDNHAANDGNLPDRQRRRLTLAMLACLSAAPLLSPPWTALAKTADVVSREHFRLLSIYLTRYARLDEKTLDAIYDALIHEPWGKEHMKRLLGKLFPALPESTKPRSEYLVVRHLDEGEAWFAGHVLTTWMTGIYYHQTGNRTLTYRHALMFEALQDLRPIPGLSEEPFGYWSKPPKAHAS